MNELEQVVAERDEARLETARTRAIHTHNLGPGDVEFLTGTTPEVIEAQAARLAARSQEALTLGNCVPSEGGNPRHDHWGTPERRFVRDLFGFDP